MNTWRTTARRAAMVAGLFTMAVAAGLLLRAGIGEPDDPLQTDALAAMEADLKQRPDDASLREAIRDADVALRAQFFQRQHAVHLGGWLLLIGAALAVGAAKLGERPTRGEHLPAPPAAADAERAASRSRLAVGATGVLLLVSAGLLVAMVAEPHLPGPGDESATDDGADVERPPTAAEIAANWPAFRGPGAMGVAADRDPPLTWDVPAGVNVAWRAQTDLPGQSSPIVWGDRVFVTAADAERRTVMCFALDDGRALWTHEVDLPAAPGAEPPEVMAETGFAAPSPVTDGRRVYAIFATGDLVAVDFDGRRVWAKALGPLTNMYGHSTSLICDGERVIVQLDQGEREDETPNTLTCYDGRTGGVVWRAERHTGATWTSPCLGGTSTGRQLITVANGGAIAYAPATGEMIWRIEDFEGDLAPSPILAGDRAILIKPGSEMLAVRTDGRGEVDDTGVAWRAEQDIPDITSPVADDERVYTLTTTAMLTARRLDDGTMVWEKEISPNNCQASPTLVTGERPRLYLFDEDGVGVVVDPATGERIGGGPVGDWVFASPAFVGRRIVVRTEKGLVCLAEAAP